MDFEFDAIINGPVERVLTTLRDRLVELVPYLPTVDGIEEVERTVDGPLVNVVNAWQGNSKALPTFAKLFATKAMTSWRDYALWNADERTVEWRFEPNRLKRLYTCRGKNFLTDMGDGTTRLRIAGSLVIHPKRIPLPGPLARRMAPRLEKWAVGRVRPNLAEVPQALQAFLLEERPAT